MVHDISKTLSESFIVKAKDSFFFPSDQISLGLVWFYSISTIVGYLMPNPFLYI